MHNIKLEASFFTNQKFSIDNFRQTYKVKDVEFQFVSPSINELEKYKYLLLSSSTTEVLLDKYKMRPNYLTYDVYGSLNLDYILLFMNNCFCYEDFVMKYVIIPNKNSILTLIRDNILNSKKYELKIIDYNDNVLIPVNNKRIYDLIENMTKEYFDIRSDTDF